MKEITILIVAAFAISATILILTNNNDCESGYHMMPDGICMSNMEKM